MRREDAERLIREKLSEIAPETAGSPMDYDASFRDQFDLDSMCPSSEHLAQLAA
jgi:hypothetical protein